MSRSPELWRRWVALFEDDGADEPRYEPVHLAAVVIGCQVAAGALFWLLWTLFVYEGGLPGKIAPFLSVALGRRPASDFGWFGAPDRQGAFEGWLANIAALAIALFVVGALYRADPPRREK